MKPKYLKLAVTALIGMAIVLSAAILASGYKYKFVSAETILTTGLAEKEFTSDLAVWTVSYNNKSINKQEGFARLKKDAKTIKEYLLSKGFKENELVFSAINSEKHYTYNEYRSNGEYRQEQVFDGYILSQNVRIESKNLSIVELASREITDLINVGIEINSESPSYYYTKLEDLKIELISKATENATLRAKQIAEKSGSDLGNLKSATMGVFQITGRNSSEQFEWGGVFNTTDKDKKASITVKLSFGID